MVSNCFIFQILVSARLVSRDVVAKLILMSVPLLRVTMEEAVLTYLKGTDADAHPDFLVKIAKKRKVIANPTHAQHVQCVRTNQAMETLHVYAEVVTPELIAISPLIHVQQTEIHAQMALLALH